MDKQQIVDNIIKHWKLTKHSDKYTKEGIAKYRKKEVRKEYKNLFASTGVLIFLIFILCISLFFGEYLKDYFEETYDNSLLIMGITIGVFILFFVAGVIATINSINALFFGGIDKKVKEREWISEEVKKRRLEIEKMNRELRIKGNKICPICKERKYFPDTNAIMCDDCYVVFKKYQGKAWDEHWERLGLMVRKEKQKKGYSEKIKEIEDWLLGEIKRLEKHDYSTEEVVGLLDKIIQKYKDKGIKLPEKWKEEMLRNFDNIKKKTSKKIKEAGDKVLGEVEKVGKFNLSIGDVVGLLENMFQELKEKEIKVPGKYVKGVKKLKDSIRICPYCNVEYSEVVGKNCPYCNVKDNDEKEGENYE